MTVRTLGEWLGYLEQLHPSAIDMGLDRSRQVMQQMALGRPAPLVITVTGTNGKGSTCAFIAELLQARGMRVGVYSSPHLLRYNERVRLQGDEVGDAALCEAFEAVEQGRGNVSLTYFEMGTLAAFWLFERASLDAVVLEVGLGGRLDAVNLVDADLALVTSIGVDHAEWLGDTRETVAFEKAGIFRAGRPALCGDPEPPASLLEQARVLGCPLAVRGRDFDLQVGTQSWCWQGKDRQGRSLVLEHLPLLDLPMENAALALQAVASLELPWQPQGIAETLLRTRITGRLDRREVRFAGKKISILLDVGHNPHASRFLAQRLAARPLASKRLAVFGLLCDKDLNGVIEPLLAHIESWAAAPLPTPRSRSATELADALREQGARVQACDNVVQALEAQLVCASEGDEILLFGSFYSVAEGLQWLARHAAEGN